MGGPEMGGLKWGPESAHCAAYGCSPHWKYGDWVPERLGTGPFHEFMRAFLGPPTDRQTDSRLTVMARHGATAERMP